MSGELSGQLPLFEDIRTVRAVMVDGRTNYEWTNRVTGHVLWPDLAFSREEEVCDECGTCCTSSKECVEISGLYDEEES